MRVAAIQMVSSLSLSANLLQARELLNRAAEACAELVLLPENFATYGNQDPAEVARAEAGWDGPVGRFLAEQSAAHGFWLVGGTVPALESLDGKKAAPGKVFAACTAWSPAGELVARYDKCHLFDAQVADKVGQYRESDTTEPGAKPICLDIGSAKVGLSVCYDLRFPEYFRLLRQSGADIVLVPSAFTYLTGSAHWEVLLRARAIENQVFVIAAGQGGQHENGRATWGHSCVVSPWGEILSEQTEEGPGVVIADIDLGQLPAVRERMPVMAHRRF